MRILILAALLGAAVALPTQTIAGEAATAADVARHAEHLLTENYPTDGPGAALLVTRGDEVLYRGARGMASVELGVPLSADQVFRIGSVTKQFSAAGLLTLVDAGKLSLDNPLSKFLADYPNGDRISVRELLNHTSGVKSYTDIPGVMAGPIRRDLTTAQLIDTFKDLPVDFAPGTDWAYNNSGYILVGAVIEAVSGKPWYAYLDEALFTPRGLSHTRYGDDGAIIAGMVRGYTLADGKLAPMAYLSMTQPQAAGALVSTVDDLVRWNRALHGGELLSDATYAQMITPTGPAKEAHYGFGITHDTLRGRDALDHSGGIFGFLSYLMYLPESGVSVAIMQNSDGVAEGKMPPGSIARRIAAIAIGDPYPEATPIKVEPAMLESYVGVYRLDASTARTLRVIDGELTAQRTGGPRAVLTPIAKDVFLYDDGFNRIHFERDVAGKVSAMRFFPNGEGKGEVVARSDEPLPTERKAIDVPHAALERITGRYEGPAALRIFLEGNQLKAQLTGQPAFDLFAESPNRYFLTAVDATLDFAPAEGKVSGVILHQGGADIEFKRVADD